jgi:hypothetical protein
MICSDLRVGISKPAGHPVNKSIELVIRQVKQFVPLPSPPGGRGAPSNLLSRTEGRRNHEIAKALTAPNLSNTCTAVHGQRPVVQSLCFARTDVDHRESQSRIEYISADP